MSAPGEPAPLEQLSFQAQELFDRHPPLWHHPNKHVVFSVSCPPGRPHPGTIAYSRWPAMPLPDAVDLGGALDSVVDAPGFFDYEPYLAEGSIEWHVNFADPHLFCAYDSALFAQDEMQVAEHPILGSLTEALRDRAMPAVTVQAEEPTPVLVRGVERPMPGRHRVGRRPGSTARPLRERLRGRRRRSRAPRDNGHRPTDHHEPDCHVRPAACPGQLHARADRLPDDDGVHRVSDGDACFSRVRRRRPGRGSHRLLGLRGVRR
jgi:hypothetical protein